MGKEVLVPVPRPFSGNGARFGLGDTEFAPKDLCDAMPRPGEGSESFASLQKAELGFANQELEYDTWVNRYWYGARIRKC